jgi:2-succinyl-6-hydroxy-2,4-cyclohexadiene-1-carboxylate synthase
MTSALRRVRTAGGVSLAVRDEGTGPAALLLHGFTGSAETLTGVRDALRASHRVIRPDLVGHGESDAPDDDAAYTMPACVAQLLALLDALEVERADVIGYSMGGRAALSLAAAAPARVRSLALVGATPGLAAEADRAARQAADEALARRILADGVEAFVDAWMALPLFASQQRLGPEALAAARAQRLRCRAEGLAGSLRGMGTGAMPALHAALPRLAMPVLLVVGAEDTKFRDIAFEMAASIADAEVAIVAQAGHAAHLEQPAAFAEVLLGFLQGVARRPSGALR